jgi:hypothetical protein
MTSTQLTVAIVWSVSKDFASCEGSRGSFCLATKALEEIMQRDPGHGVHVLCSSKMDAERILMSFSRYECRMATSDTASVVRSRSCQEWGEGIPSFGLPTCAGGKVENVNCRHVAGYLYLLRY